MTQYEFHEYATLFPILEGEELEALRADIEENGQINKIILYKGKILDGRNRYTVCEMLGIEPETIEYTGDDPLGLIVSQNINRRHLTTSQRSLIAAKLANWANGGDRRSEKFQSANLQTEIPDPISWKMSQEAIERRKQGLPEPISQSEAAEKLNVSTRSVADAAKVVKNAVPEVVEAVESGRLAVSTAVTLAEKTHDQQRKILAKSEKEGNGRLGKDGKIRPAEYKKRVPKKTVAQEPHEESDFAERYQQWLKNPAGMKTPVPEQNEQGIIKLVIPLDHRAMFSAFAAVFRKESEEVRNSVITEIKILADVISNLND
jgi:ParB-like chromosome segregation protein Spo0J